jgi:glycosyltransferase involved in cell wall biosynthesis
MHIGIDARFLGGTSYGLAQYSENLLLSLARIDRNNDYTVFVNAGLQRKLKLGDNFRLVPIWGRPLSANGLARMRLALRKDPCEFLHVHFPLAPLGTDTPTLITVHDVVPFEHGDGKRRQVTLWDRVGWFFLYPRTMRAARWILCVSKSTRDKLVQIYPEVFHKTIILASGVEDIYKTKTEAPAKQLIRSRLGLPESYILYSGSSGETKNIPRMIQAYARLRHRNPEAQTFKFVLDLTGDLSGINEIRNLIRQFGIEKEVILFTGMNADERHVLFEDAGVLFIASTEEGFGFPLLKAQLAGVPVVAADSGALPEICGEGGLLVDPEDIDEMTTMLDQAVFDETLRSYLTERGRENARRYSWDSTGRQVKQIYELLF